MYNAEMIGGIGNIQPFGGKPSKLTLRRFKFQRQKFKKKAAGCCTGRFIEFFSFECRKVIGFVFATLRDWLKKLAPLFHPIRSKTKTNRDSLARVFPRFASATCNYFAF